MEVIPWNEIYFAYYLFIYFFCLLSFLLNDFTLLIDMLCCIPEIVMKTSVLSVCVFIMSYIHI